MARCVEPWYERSRATTECLPHDLDSVFVGVGAAQCEEHAAALESTQFEQASRQVGARLCAPGVRHETQLLRLRADRRDDARMLVSEIAALRKAAHVEHAAPILQMQPGAGATHDGRRVPGGLRAPAVQDGIALRSHAIPVVERLMDSAPRSA